MGKQFFYYALLEDYTIKLVLSPLLDRTAYVISALPYDEYIPASP